MRLPQAPPPLEKLFAKVGTKRMAAMLPQAATLWRQDRYLHWNELRRRPAPDDLTHEEWWLLVKMGRGPNLRQIPLADKAGRPFQFSIPVQLIELLHLIDRGLGSAWNLPAAVTHPSTRGEYVVSTLIQESITSSQLEGAVTTRDVAKEMLRSGRAPRDKSERMILNNYRTMQRIMDVRAEPLTPELVFELHRRVTEGTLEREDAAGRFRTDAELIRVMDMEGNVFHEPPPAIELPQRLAAMCDFANQQTPEFFLHPVIRAILLHFWLAYDHPFVDGNGRTARALFYWLMLHQGLELFEFISISQILLQAPTPYALAFLHTETDDNDLTYFILHQASVIRRAVQALHDFVAHKTALLRSTEKHLRTSDAINHRQQALLAHAIRNPDTRYTIAGHCNSHAVVYQTGRTDLLNLVELGLLTVRKSGRAMVFRAVEDLEGKLANLAKGETPRPLNTEVGLPLNWSPPDERTAR
ncbi:MAG TPA: Fic family protein [Opitutaceae bacterium]|nr:Fic family protein [Opitutaceae bacterium]